MNSWWVILIYNLSIILIYVIELHEFISWQQFDAHRNLLITHCKCYFYFHFTLSLLRFFALKRIYCNKWFSKQMRQTNVSKQKKSRIIVAISKYCRPSYVLIEWKIYCKKSIYLIRDSYFIIISKWFFWFTYLMLHFMIQIFYFVWKWVACLFFNICGNPIFYIY